MPDETPELIGSPRGLVGELIYDRVNKVLGRVVVTIIEYHDNGETSWQSVIGYKVESQDGGTPHYIASCNARKVRELSSREHVMKEQIKTNEMVIQQLEDEIEELKLQIQILKGETDA